MTCNSGSDRRLLHSNVFPIFQDNPSMWPHGWWQALPHNHHSHICKWPQDKLNGPKHPLSTVDDLFITTIFYLCLAFKDESRCSADFSYLCSSNVSQVMTGHWSFTGSVILTDDSSLRPHPWGAQMGCGLMWHQIILFWNLKPSEASTPGMKDANVYLLLLVCCNADPGCLIPANEGGRQTEGPPGFTQVKLDFISFIYCRLSQDHSRSLHVLVCSSNGEKKASSPTDSIVCPWAMTAPGLLHPWCSVGHRQRWASGWVSVPKAGSFHAHWTGSGFTGFGHWWIFLFQGYFTLIKR